jgi:transcriptional regulator with XRE-family HTH domain
MNDLSFGEYIKIRREELSMPLRKVASHLDIDTSTLSKVERGVRPASVSYLKPLSEILNLDLKDIQTNFIADKIAKDFAGLEHLQDGLKAAENKLNQKRK